MLRKQVQVWAAKTQVEEQVDFVTSIRPFHKTNPHIAVLPAPPDIAVQMYNRGTMPTMLAKLKSGQSNEQVASWASDELEGFTR